MPNESNKKTERVSLSNNKVAYYIPNFAAAIAAIEKELVFWLEMCDTYIL